MVSERLQVLVGPLEESGTRHVVARWEQSPSVAQCKIEDNAGRLIVIRRWALNDNVASLAIRGAIRTPMYLVHQRMVKGEEE